MKPNNLKKRIEEEMTANYANMLEKNFDIAKTLLRITPSGTVDVLRKQDLQGTDKILLYLIGKRYAKEAGMTDSEYVQNKELGDQLGIKRGSMLPWIKSLRDAGFLDGSDGKQAIKTNLIESVLLRISATLGDKK